MKHLLASIQFNYLVIFIVGYFFTSEAILCQEAKLSSITPPSPNVASLGKFVDVPVSTYTGVPSISVPIFNMDVGETLPFSVSLDYNASGIKVAEVASNVGLGWAFNAGGMISRSIVGLADNLPDKGFLNNNYTPEYFNGLTHMQLYDFWHQNLSEKTLVDIEPDEYYFNFCGKSGKIIIDRGLIISCVPSNNWKIELVNFLDDNNNTKWIITTEDGTQFYFGKSFDNTRTAIDHTSNWTTGGSVGSSETITGESAWHLLDVRFPNSGDFLNFFYTAYNQQYCTPNNDSYTHYDWTSNLCPSTVTNPSSDVWSFTYGNVSISGNRLTRVESTKFNIDIVSSFPRQDIIGDYAINSLKVYSNTNNLVKEFKLWYSHFYSADNLLYNICACANGDASRRYRLKLDSISEYASNKFQNHYLFAYNEYGPERLSHQVDYWGYYNAQSANTNYIPKWTYKNTWGQYITVADGANRYPNGYSAAFILNKITYPTGGYTNFEYENHDAYEQDFIGEGTPVPVSLGCVYMGKLSTGIPGFKQYGSNVKVVLNPLENPCSFDLRCDEGNDGDCGFKIKIVDGEGKIAWESFGSILANQSTTWEFYLPKYNDKDGYDLVLEPCSSLTDLTDVYCCIWGLNSPSGNNTPYNKTIGGLRIKKITQLDAIGGTPLIKVYSYKDASGKSTGNIGVKPQYHYSIPYDYYSSITAGPYLCVKGQAQIFLSNPAIDLSYANGSSVDYSQVTITNVSSDGTNLGSETIYHTTFSDFPDYYINEYPFLPKSNINWKRGLEIKSEIKKNVSGADILIQKNSNTYNYLLDNTNFTKQMFGVKLAPDRLNNINYFDYANPRHIINQRYFIYTGNQFKSNDTLRTFIDGENVIEKTNCYYYENPNYLEMTKKVEKNSNGDIIETSLKYPFDGIDGAINNVMVTNNDVSTIILKEIKNNGNIIDGKYFHYQLWDNSHILVSQIKKLVGGSYIPDQTFDNYNGYGNLLEYHKAEDTHTSIIWGYGGNYPIAETKNASSNECGYTSFENLETQGWFKTSFNLIEDPSVARSGKSYIAGTTNSDVVYNIFSVGLQAGGHSGYKASVWVKGTTDAYIKIEVIGQSSLYKTTYNPTNNHSGGWNLISVELPYVVYKDYVTSSLQLKVTCGSNSTPKFDDLRFHPMDAQMKTYTYDPLIGVTSESDVNNKPSKYEYDNLGRLLLVRDFKGNILKKYTYHYRK